MKDNLKQDYENRCAGLSGSHQDIKEHLPVLSKLAEGAGTIVEFGVRTGNSTCAFLHGLELGGGGTLYSYDLGGHTFGKPELENANWVFTQADTGKLENIPPCDILFIDTLHTQAQVTAELRQAPYVEKFIIFHDSVNNGDRGEGDQPGITRAIYQFLAQNWKEWRVYAEYPNNNGLLILARIP